MSSLVWVELDARAAAHNLRELRKGIGTDVALCAVVKANAYGHGVREMAGILNGADWFGVNSFEEAIELETYGVDRPILILGHVPDEQLAEAVRREFRLTVYNPRTLACLGALEPGLPPARVHVKIETGTGRQGVTAEDLQGFLDVLTATANIVLEGVSTHYADIEDTMNHDYSALQLDRFHAALARLSASGRSATLVHSAATAALILFPETHFSLVRAGIGVYGLWPSRETYLSSLLEKRPISELMPVLSWKTRIAQIKTLPEGSAVGYGCTYKTTRSTRIAVLPVGYADGYDRGLGNTAHVLVRGRRAPVVGRICMNMFMVDVTDVPQVGLEDVVVLLGASGGEVLTAETMASWLGTINYEVVTRISPLLPRKVVN